MSNHISSREREAFNRVKRHLLRGIEQIREANPAAAQYLESHLVMDEQACTFMYTGDDRLQMSLVDRYELVKEEGQTRTASSGGGHRE